MKVGILAIQGDFAAHARALAACDHATLAVRRAADLEAVEALVLPGGESTAMLKGIARDGLEEPLRSFFSSGKPVLATCAGAILLARTVSGPAQPSFGVLDIDVERNAYGTQIDSFEAEAEVDDADSPFVGLRCILIRAPRIARAGAGVHVHARIRGAAALVSRGPIWAATFHPELSSDRRVIHAAFGGNGLGSRPVSCQRGIQSGAERPTA